MSVFNRKRLQLSAIGILALVVLVSYSIFNGRPNELAAELEPPPWNQIRNETLRERIHSRYLKTTHGIVSTSALSDLGQLYHSNGYLNLARQVYELLRERGLISPEERHRLARILSAYGLQRQAIDEYKRVLASNSDYTPAHIHLGNALLKSGDAGQAETAFRSAIETDSQSAHALLGLARIRIERKDWEEARKILEAATRISNFQIGTDILATVYEELGESNEANRLRRDHDFGAYRDLSDPWMDEMLVDCYDTFRLATAAGMASFRGDSDKANELIGRAIELDPTDPMLHFQLGGFHRSEGEIASALQSYRKSVQLKPDFSDGWFQMYQIHQNAGSPREANLILEDGFRACPDSPALLLEMAERMRRENRADRAIEFTRKAIELRPHEAQAFLVLARLFLQTNQIDAAVSAFEDALRVEPGNPMALSTLTINAIDKRDRSTADRYFERIRKQARIPPQSVEQLAAKYEAQFGSRP